MPGRCFDLIDYVSEGLYSHVVVEQRNSQFLRR